MTESRRMVNRPRMRADQTIAAGKCRPKIRRPGLAPLSFLLDHLAEHFNRGHDCPLSGVKRTWRLHCEMSAFDPKRTCGTGFGPDEIEVMTDAGCHQARAVMALAI